MKKFLLNNFQLKMKLKEIFKKTKIIISKSSK